MRQATATGQGANSADAWLTDSHAHLDAPAFAEDLLEVLGRAQQAGVRLLVVPGLDAASNRAAVALAYRHAGVYAAVGVHPHQAEPLTTEALAEIETLAQDPKVVAIGEIGLDYYRDYAPRDAQREVFQQLLGLARQMRKPVIVHDRAAHSEVLAALESHARQLGFAGGVLHSFSGDVAMARQVVGWGYHLGLGGPLTYPSAHTLREVAAQIPLRHLLLETDCPYLPPQPHRGQRNEPAWVALVADALAQAQGLPFAAVARATTNNAQRLLGLA
ncbi:MAG: TatD family hydrolase [Chloroflexi bacterium]|nr:TatD family hydrolase [Chloroflexota bacterium]